MAKRKGIISALLGLSSTGKKSIKRTSSAKRSMGMSKKANLSIKKGSATQVARPKQQIKKSSGKSTTKSTGVEKFPHFRKYLKTNHPALIVGEKSDDEYNFRKVMHPEKEGRHLNEKVIPNPDPADPKPMHIAKRVRHDQKDNFSTWKYPWKYPNK